MKAEIIEASPIEWGLIIDGQGIKTWWKSAFLGKPDLEHPKVKEALQAHAEIMNIFMAGAPAAKVRPSGNEQARSGKNIRHLLTQDDPGAYPTT